MGYWEDPYLASKELVASWQIIIDLLDWSLWEECVLNTNGKDFFFLSQQGFAPLGITLPTSTLGFYFNRVSLL